MTRVVTATVADWRRTRALRLEGLLDTPDAFGSTYAHESVQDDAFWRRRLENPDATTLLATLDGVDAGISVVAPGGDDLAIYGVWVAPFARGKGVGNALIARCIEVARERGGKRLVLEVGDHNGPAIALYARMGFEPTGNTTTLPPPREHIPEHERALEL